MMKRSLLCLLLATAATGWSEGLHGQDTAIEAAVARGHITADELASLIEEGEAPPILDVRSQKEYNKGHVPGAVNIPFNKLKKRLAEVPSLAGQPLVVYCGHGPRAWMARRTLRRNGIDNAIPLKGHWSRWRKHGHPVIGPG